MFRLNDAVRRYQAQHPSQPESRRVAASVATLSPPCRHAPGQKRRGLSPLSPLSPHHPWTLPSSPG